MVFLQKGTEQSVLLRKQASFGSGANHNEKRWIRFFFSACLLRLHLDGRGAENPVRRIVFHNLTPQHGLDLGLGEKDFARLFGHHVGVGWIVSWLDLGFVGGQVGDPSGPRAGFARLGAFRIGEGDDVLETGGERMALGAGGRGFQPGQIG